MLMTIVSFVLDYLLSSIMVGSLAFMLFGEYFQKANYLKGMLTIILIVAIKELILLPGLIELNILFKIQNESIANLFHIQDKLIALNDHVYINWFDIIDWIAQTIIAYFSGYFLYDRIVKRGLTSGSS